MKTWAEEVMCSVREAADPGRRRERLRLIMMVSEDTEVVPETENESPLWALSLSATSVFFVPFKDWSFCLGNLVQPAASGWAGNNPWTENVYLLEAKGFSSNMFAQSRVTPTVSSVCALFVYVRFLTRYSRASAMSSSQYSGLRVNKTPQRNSRLGFLVSGCYGFGK